MKILGYEVGLPGLRGYGDGASYEEVEAAARELATHYTDGEIATELAKGGVRMYAPAQTSNGYGPGASFGSDGESYESYGYLYSGGPDQNPILSGRNKFWIYNEMRRSDPAVKSLLWMFKLPIRSASWSFEEAGNGADPLDRLVAEACRWQFGVEGMEGRLDQTWDASLAQALLYLDWGCSFEELIWGEVETWVAEDGVSRLVVPLNRLAPRAPITVNELRDDPATGLLTWLWQDVAGARPIPGDKLAWYVLDKEGRNWFGTSLLRPCFGPWKLKKALSISAGITWDRYGAGVPIVRYPKGGGAEERARAERIGQNIRTHERAWVALEGPSPADSPNGEWDVEIMWPSGGPGDPVGLLRHYNGEIAMAGLQMFAKLGTTETGARAVGEVLGEPFYMAAEALANEIAAERQKRAVRRFVDRNFGLDVETPKLNVTKIMSKNIDKIAAAIANLAQAGMNFKDPDTQDAVRDWMELPELPEEVRAMLLGLPENVGVEVTATGDQQVVAGQAPPFAQSSEGVDLGYT